MPVNDVWHPIFSLTEDYHSKNYFFLPPGFNPPPLFFCCCWDSWAERDTILQIYPPPCFFLRYRPPGFNPTLHPCFFFGWDRDPWYLTSTPFFWLRYRLQYLTPVFFFGWDIHTSRMRATFPSAKPINIRVKWPNTAGVRRYPPWNYNRLLAG